MQLSKHGYAPASGAIESPVPTIGLKVGEETEVTFINDGALLHAPVSVPENGLDASPLWGCAIGYAASSIQRGGPSAGSTLLSQAKTPMHARYLDT